MAEPGPVIARDEKLVEPMTVADVPNLAKLIPAAQWNRLPDGSYPFVDVELTAIAVGYNPNFAHTVPTSWNQLADPMYKGHLLMPNMNVAAGVVLLVVLARINGGSERNIDPGFAAAAKVRQNAITLWSSHDQVATMLTQGTAWLTVESVDRLGPLNRSGAPIDIDYPRRRVVAIGNSMGIAAGTRTEAGGAPPKLPARARAAECASAPPASSFRRSRACGCRRRCRTTFRRT